MHNILYKFTLIAFFVLWLTAGFSLQSNAQVTNDGIQDRFELVLDADYTTSSTDNNSVEWACVNKAITNRCLQYHNDQWFTFSVPASGKYYLNISSQLCRDAKGIQALIIEGNPCEIKTYKVLQCIAKISQQDIFIELDSIKSNEKYLVNIDGFLGDFCKFNIQLSSTPRGLNLYAKNLDTLEFSTHQLDKVVALEWIASQETADKLQGFEIQRKFNNNLKPVFVNHVSIEHNALGKAQLNYSLQDTLSVSGSYLYEILGIFEGGVKEILTQRTIGFYPLTKAKPSLILDVSLDYKKGTPILVLLINKTNNKLLKKSSFEFNNMSDSHQRILVDMYASMGIRNFLVKCVNQKTFEEVNYEFEITENNEVIRK